MTGTPAIANPMLLGRRALQTASMRKPPPLGDRLKRRKAGVSNSRRVSCEEGIGGSGLVPAAQPHLTMIAHVDEFYRDPLRGLCSAENQLPAALPEMAGAASNRSMKRPPPTMRSPKSPRVACSVPASMPPRSAGLGRGDHPGKSVFA
jgi:hypothetical protein